MGADVLLALGAPPDFVRWAGVRSIEAVWEECPRSDWLAWLAVSASVPTSKLRRAAFMVAQSIQFVVPGAVGERAVALAVRALARQADDSAARDDADAFVSEARIRRALNGPLDTVPGEETEVYHAVRALRAAVAGDFEEAVRSATRASTPEDVCVVIRSVVSLADLTLTPPVDARAR